MSNSAIQSAFFTEIVSANFGYPVKYPAKTFTPPNSGAWLELAFLPNRGLDEGLANNASVVPQGFCQVTIFNRPDTGVIPLNQLAETVAAAFPKGLALSVARVSNQPTLMSMIELKDKISITVSIPYIG